MQGSVAWMVVVYCVSVSAQLSAQLDSCGPMLQASFGGKMIF
jgi:hypothetical protein